jgi:hypothetical protein
MMKDEQELRAELEALSESAKVDLIIQLRGQVARCVRDAVRQVRAVLKG